MAKAPFYGFMMVLLASATSACGLREFRSQKRHDSDDKVSTYSTQTPFERPTDCRAHIADAVCLVDPVGDGTTFPDNSKLRPCAEGSERYVATFEQLYDSFPSSLQKMFCSLQRIHVEKTFYGTAYANTIWIKNDATGKWGTNGGVLGVRQSILDSRMSLEAWASWKEQLSFGGIKDSYSLTANLPTVETHSAKGANDLLYFIVAHEFGHFFDEASGANQTTSCAGEGSARTCKFQEKTWGAISWQDDVTVKPEHDFPGRDKLCFYACDSSYIPVEQIPALYSGLEKSSFISSYAATNPYDDFAESFAYTVMSEHLRSSFSFLPVHADKYDVMAKLGAPAFAEKARYIANLQAELQYP